MTAMFTLVCIITTRPKTVLFKENVLNSNFGSHFFLTNYFSASESNRDLSLFNLYSVQCSWNKGSCLYSICIQFSVLGIRDLSHIT